MGGGGKSSTSTSTTTIPPEVLARYNAVNKRAEQAAATPFQQYSTDPNAFVAPLNSTQNAGIANTNASAGQAQPYYQGATGMTLAGSGQANLGGLNTNQYLSPYLNTVVQNTANQLNNQNQQQSSALKGSAIQAGAFGGDRAGIAQGNLANQQSLANAQTLSGLLNTGYQQAQGVAQQQQGAQLSAEQANLAREQAGGAQLANIGNQAQTSALQGASAQLTAGQTQQQTQQAGLTALYNQFLQQQSYPFQVSQFLANIAEGTGALSGSTTSTTSPSSFFSDKRLKEDIEPIGKTFDGQNIYKFRYKDKPGVQMGLMAQDVEKKHPKAVGLAGGYRTVDYDEATKDAAERGHFRSGGLVPAYADGGSAGIDTTDENPYGGAKLFDIQPLILRKLMLSQPVRPQQQPQNDISQVTGLANDAKSLYNDGKSIYDGVTSLKSGGRAGYAGGGGPYDQLTGAPASNENTPNYAAMTAIPPVVAPTGDNLGPDGKPKTTTTDPNSQDASKAPVTTTSGAPATPAISGIDAATHGGMGNAANMRSGGRAGYDDGGGLPYQEDNQEDVTTPQYLKQKTGLNPNGISIPDQQNTHGLMTAQNPTGAPTSGLGGLAQAGNLAKDIYGLGSGIAGLVAPTAAATTAAAAPAAIGAGLGAGAAGAGAAGAAAGGGGVLSSLLAFLPFLSTGGSVDRKHFDDGGNVGDDTLQDASTLPALSVDDLKAMDAAENARRVAAATLSPAATPAPAAATAQPSTPAAAPVNQDASSLPALGVDDLRQMAAAESARRQGALRPVATPSAGLVPSLPEDNSPPADLPVAANDTGAATGVVPRGAHAIAADVLSSFGSPKAAGVAPASGTVPDATGDSTPTGLAPSSAPATVPASNVPNPNNRLVTPQEAQVAQGPSGGGGSPREAVLARIASGEAKNYNQLVGGGTFDGYSQFPKWGGVQGPEGVSHAAGLYQFQPGTYAAEAQKLGLKDFSPASQDAAAWDLAQTTYKQKTGRDLEADASSGNVQWGALGGQWSSLRGAKAGPPGSASLPTAGGTQEHLGDGSGGDNTSSIGGPSGGTGGLTGAANSATGWLGDPSNRNLLLSILSGLGKMASSNSRYFGAAALQGIGGGADTYAALQKQQADIGRTNADTNLLGQQAGLTGAHTGLVKQQTATEKSGLYEKTFVPGKGWYVYDKSNPNAPPKQISDANGNAVAGVNQTDVPTTTPGTPAGNTGGDTTGGGSATPPAVTGKEWQPVTEPPPDYAPPGQMNMTFSGGLPAERENAAGMIRDQRAKAQAAYGQQQQLAQMSHEFDQLPQSGVMTPGAFADQRMAMAKAANTMSSILGGKPLFDENNAADVQAIQKGTFRLGAALSSSLGKGEAADIVNQAVGANPGIENTPLGFKKVVASLQQAAQEEQDRNAFYDNYYQKFQHLNGAPELFEKLNPAENYAKRAVLSTVDPADISAFKEYAAKYPNSQKAAQAIDAKYGAGTSSMILGQ